MMQQVKLKHSNKPFARGVECFDKWSNLERCLAYDSLVFSNGLTNS